MTVSAVSGAFRKHFDYDFSTFALCDCVLGGTSLRANGWIWVKCWA